jgi:hypothetical protein
MVFISQAAHDTTVVETVINDALVEKFHHIFRFGVDEG